MPTSSKFLTESAGENIVKIGQYLVKIWAKYDSLLFWGHPDLVWFCFKSSRHKYATRTIRRPHITAKLCTQGIMEVNTDVNSEQGITS